MTKPSTSWSSTTQKEIAIPYLSRPKWHKSSLLLLPKERVPKNHGPICLGILVCAVVYSSLHSWACLPNGLEILWSRKFTLTYIFEITNAKFDRYYLSDLLTLVGIVDPVVKSKINVGLAVWGLGCCTILALIVPRFRRRPAYLLCASLLLCVYIAWTISMERYLVTKVHGAAIATIVFIFLYQPAYIIGYNALTYSESHLHSPRILCWQSYSLPRRTFSLPSPLQRNLLVPILRPRCWILLNLRQPCGSSRHPMEMAACLCVLVGVRDCVHLLLLSGDGKPYFGGVGFQWVPSVLHEWFV